MILTSLTEVFIFFLIFALGQSVSTNNFAWIHSWPESPTVDMVWCFTAIISPILFSLILSESGVNRKVKPEQHNLLSVTET